MTFLYADASRHNGTIDWSKVTIGVLLKASGSDDGVYADSAYASNAKAARAHGKLVGHYHFNGGSPAAAAAFFVDHLVGYEDGDLVVLDIENEGSMPAWTPAQALAGFKAIRARKPKARLVAYMDEDIENREDWSAVVAYGVELWLAHYGRNDGTITGSGSFALRHWPKPLLVQYTSAGRAAGFSGDLDLSYAPSPLTPPSAPQEDDVIDNKGSGTYSPKVPLLISTTGWTNWAVDDKGNYSIGPAGFSGLVDIDVATRIEGLPQGHVMQARFVVVTTDTAGKVTSAQYSDVVELQGSSGAAFPSFSDKVVVHANQRVRLLFTSQVPGAVIRRVGLSVARFHLTN